MHTLNRLALVFSMLLATRLSAQSVPALLALPSTGAVTTDSLASIASIRELPNGSVLVHDQTRRRVLLFDTALRLVRIVADSTPATRRLYGAKTGGLIPYRQDSVLFINPASFSMHVIGPDGRVVRTMAAPRTADLPSLTGGFAVNAGFDPKGRLIYRSPGTELVIRPPSAGQALVPPATADSVALVRFDVETRRVDTMTYYRVRKTRLQVDADKEGNLLGVTTLTNSMSVADDWAILSNGTVAIVRGQDLHVDFLSAEGRLRKGGRIPHDWQRLTDDDKVRISDSTRNVAENMREANRASERGSAASSQPDRTRDTGSPSASGVGRPSVQSASTRKATDKRPEAVLMPILWPAPSDLSDYKPALAIGATRADMQSRLWIRTYPSALWVNGPIYYVVDSIGTLVRRVQVPPQSTIAGFGRQGVVFLGLRDANGALRLKRIVDR